MPYQTIGSLAINPHASQKSSDIYDSFDDDDSAEGPSIATQLSPELEKELEEIEDRLDSANLEG